MKRFLTLATVAILNGCGATSSYYILSNVHDTSAIKHSNISVGVEKVEVPKYLFKRELATLSSNNQVEFIPDVQWAEDMDEALTRRVIGSLQKRWHNPNVSSYPWGVDKQPTAILHINITKFIAQNSKVYLDATYRITNTKTSYSKSYMFDTQVALQDSNPESIVSSMDKAVERLIDDIARRM